jgi:hypothetical protein
MDQLDLRFICQICGDGSMNVCNGHHDRFGLGMYVPCNCLRFDFFHLIWINHHHRATSFDGISEWYEVIRELPEKVKHEELIN